MLDAVRSLGSGGIVAGAGALASSVSHVDPGTLVLIAGGVIWALATWRRDKRQVVLDNNKDLMVRTGLVEQERDRLVKHTADLEAELKRRPDLGSLELLVKTLTEKVLEHDDNTSELGKAILGGQDALTQALDRNTQAVQLWATDQARRV